MRKLKLFIFSLIILSSFGFFSPKAEALYRWNGLGLKNEQILQPAPSAVSPTTGCYMTNQGGCKINNGKIVNGFNVEANKTKCSDAGVCCKIYVTTTYSNTTNIDKTNVYQSQDKCIANWSEGDPGSSGVEIPVFVTRCIASNFDCCCPNGQAAAPLTSEKPNIIIPHLEVKIPTVELSSSTCVLNEKGIWTCPIPWIGEYINGIYKYGINIAGILAALVLMGGGLLWLISGGDSSKITQAKNMIIGSITGLIILMCSYIILIQVNPDLVKIKSISMGYILKDIIPAPVDSVEFSKNCLPTNVGNCAVTNMSGFGEKAQQASGICMAESGGNASVHNPVAKCTDANGTVTGYPVWGLFQFNLSANTFVDASGTRLNCPKAFNKDWTNSRPSCIIIDRSLYDACVKAANDPKLSIKNAITLLGASAKSKGGSWGPWEANINKCHFPK